MSHFWSPAMYVEQDGGSNDEELTEFGEYTQDFLESKKDVNRFGDPPFRGEQHFATRLHIPPMADSLRRELERWGFSEGEIDVYLAVLDVGEGLASEIGEAADVSARHVYRVCERLEERGLVDVDEHVQPTRIRARPPSVVEDVIERSASTMSEQIESRYAGTPDQTPEIEVFKRQPTVMARATDIIAEADTWAIVVLPPDLVDRFASDLRAAVERGVLVILITEAAETDQPLDELATIVRTRDGPHGFQDFGIGADKVRSLMVSSADMGDGHRYSPALYVNDDTIAVRTNDSLFGIEYRLSEEYLVPDPATLPATPDSFREATLQAGLHRRVGTPLMARVEGRSLADGRRHPIEGRVVEVRQGLIEPFNQSFLGERTIVLETDDGRVSVGGPPATLEDYAAESVTLFREE
ncbi:MAG: TrmB family transcriptional regulator [Halococcoides sp.]